MPAWYKINQSDIENYQDALYSKLICIAIPDDLINCHDIFCDKQHHQHAIGDLCVSIVSACLGASDHTLPKRGPRKKLSPYWSDLIQPHKDCSLFWHSIWTENGKPRHGIVAQIMRQTRAKYHYFVRWAAKNHSDLRRSRMAESVATGSTRDLWTECKHISRSGTARTTEIDGVTGDQNIADLFAAKYEVIYNSASAGYQEISEIHSAINSQIKNENSMDIAQVDIIEVTNAISALNANKSDGSLGLYSNHLLIASSHLHRYIALLFTFMLRHGHNPDYIMEAIISSIPKNANGHTSDSENYRGIALSSAIGKVLDIIIMNRYSNELMSSDVQFSFKPKHSTVMCTAAMREIVSHYTSRSSRVYMCALDATKAFDKVNFPKLFHLLLKRNVPSVILRIVLDMYTRQSIKATWNGTNSCPINVSNGVRQGGVLSPILFNVYMDELLQRLQKQDIGCHIGTIFMGALCYADDLITLCPTRRGLQKMINVCQEFAYEHDVVFNPKKTVCMLFGCKNRSKWHWYISWQGEAQMGGLI